MFQCGLSLLLHVMPNSDMFDDDRIDEYVEFFHKTVPPLHKATDQIPSLWMYVCVRFAAVSKCSDFVCGHGMGSNDGRPKLNPFIHTHNQLLFLRNAHSSQTTCTHLIERQWKKKQNSRKNGIWPLLLRKISTTIPFEVHSTLVESTSLAHTHTHTVAIIDTHTRSQLPARMK